MKKNYMIYGIAALTCLLAAACAKVETAEPAQEEETLTENVVVFKATASEDDTKAEITLADGDFSWTATSDKIAVATNEGYKISTGATGVSGNKADFSVSLGTATLNTNAFALYPHTLVWDDDAEPAAARTDCNPSHDGDGDNLVVYLPDSYPIGDVTSPKVPCPMIASIVVDGEGALGNLSFKQLCAVLCIQVNSIPASANTLVLDFNGKKVSGKFEVEALVVPGSSSIVAAEGSDDTITITGLDYDDWKDNLVINIPVPTGVAESNVFTNLTVTAKNGATTVLEMTRPIKVGATNWVPQRAMRRKIVASLPAFSVSNDVRVHIAKSNLQLTRPDTDKTWAQYQTDGQLTWSFMDYPWSVETEKDMAVDYANKTAVRCFSWGTSGYNFNETTPDSYGAYYLPWNTADGETRQGSDFGPKGTAVGLTGTFTYGDWGRKICGEDKTALDDHSGYGASKDWRLFTRDEVLYLFGKTEDATFDGGANYITTGDATEGTICFTRRHNSWSVYKINTDTNPAYGLILVPDYFVDPTGVFVECSRYGYGNYGNSFTAAQWSLMEEAGAAFLPVSVRVLRNSNGGLAPDTNFSYWTSTVRTDVATHAWALQFTGSQNNWRVLPTDNGVNRRNGLPVRLIRVLN